MTDEQVWKEMSELPSPMIFRAATGSPDRQGEESKKPAAQTTPTFVKQLSDHLGADSKDDKMKEEVPAE